MSQAYLMYVTELALKQNTAGSRFSTACYERERGAMTPSGKERPVLRLMHPSPPWLHFFYESIINTPVGTSESKQNRDFREKNLQVGRVFLHESKYGHKGSWTEREKTCIEDFREIATQNMEKAARRILRFLKAVKHGSRTC